MALQVERIDRHDKRALHRFVTFPWKVYAGDANWVPPLIAEKGDEPVGFAIALPDVNFALRKANGQLFPFGLIKILWYARHIDMLRVPMLGIVPELRGSGIDQLLYLRLFQGGRKLKIVRGEFSWILEDNLPIRQALEKLGARVYKTYRIYEKEVSPPR